MHTYNGKSATFHFDGGLKGGDLIIHKNSTGEEIRINADDVIELVAYEYVMPEKIRKIEQATAEHLLTNE